MSGIFTQSPALRVLLFMLAINFADEARPAAIVPVVSTAPQGVEARVSPNTQDRPASPAQPKGALFNKESGTSRSAVGSGWFLFGLYVLIALLFSGLSGYAAVTKGLNPIPYFFFGFFLSAFGYLYVLTRPSAANPGEVPAGLVKVHTTLEPVPCPKCDNSNHPAAKKCSSCGAELQPSVQSEVMRVK